MTDISSRHTRYSIAILKQNKFHSDQILSFSLDQFIFCLLFFDENLFFSFRLGFLWFVPHVAECGIIDSNWWFDRRGNYECANREIVSLLCLGGIHQSKHTMDRRSNEATGLFSESHGRCRRALLRTLTTGQVISAQLLMDRGWHDRSIRLPRHRSKSCIHVLERLSPVIVIVNNHGCEIKFGGRFIGIIRGWN